jgi:hypothetical protein
LATSAPSTCPPTTPTFTSCQPSRKRAITPSTSTTSSPGAASTGSAASRVRATRAAAASSSRTQWSPAASQVTRAVSAVRATPVSSARLRVASRKVIAAPRPTTHRRTLSLSRWNGASPRLVSAGAQPALQARQ